MPKPTTLADCVKTLKADLQAIAGERTLQQNNDNLDSELLYHTQAVNHHLNSAQKTMEQAVSELGSSLIDKTKQYSQHVLQAAWNVADILEQVIQFSPREWILGVTRGFTANGVDGKRNVENFESNLDFLDPETNAPYIIDEQTLHVAEAMQKFINNIEQTTNGRSLLSYLPKDKQGKNQIDIIKETLTARIQAYKKILTPPSIETTQRMRTSVQEQRHERQQTAESSADVPRPPSPVGH